MNGTYATTEQGRFIRNALTRKEEILEGWVKLNQRIEDYIMRNITRNIESLPYIKV
ncbi:MAG: hypothetical protein KKC96_00475 [Nanoarchaeota archaeon]|nr:hypothetical protein [Nanoarchaeota archaeon]MBU2459315.1 hypothetical protein [Nanoarchaeota archaeon]